jgi:leucyl-tRNA synthetase
MDTFMCSSWYLYRYVDPKNDKEPWSKEEIRKWLPVDIYIGGAEHTNMHLLYFRFIAKVLFDAGLGADRRARHPPVSPGHGLRRDRRHHVEVQGQRHLPSEIMDEWGVDVCRLAMFAFAPSGHRHQVEEGRACPARTAW